MMVTGGCGRFQARIREIYPASQLCTRSGGSDASGECTYTVKFRLDFLSIGKKLQSPLTKRSMDHREKLKGFIGEDGLSPLGSG